MQRIISGEYKGRVISSLPTKSARPTQARVRKSMLEIFEPLSDKKVLDLFAGSGVLGIEALSRGARSLVSIENDREIFKILRGNLNKICKKENFRTLCMNAIDYLMNCDEKFDIIICDPPYNKYNHIELFNISSPHLNKGGLFCMEMKKKDVDKNIFRIKRYGSTQLVIWREND